MINVRRISYPEDREPYIQAFLWQRVNQTLYGDNIGFTDLDAFCCPGDETLDLAIEEDGALLAFCSLMLRGPKSCQAALIAPERPRVRSIIAGIQALQRAYFDDLGYYYLYVSLSDGEEFDRARKLARLLGWREVNPNYFEFH